MSNLLETIVAEKKKEVELIKEIYTLKDFERTDNYGFFHASLKKELIKKNSTGIIAEFKRKSPSQGWLTEQNIQVYDIVQAYQKYGAAGISIITDNSFFGGTTHDLQEAHFSNKGPFLRKDFIIDEFQIHESNAFGADVILLIAAILTKQQVKQFAKSAKEQGMEVLLEIHEESELDSIVSDVDIIGVNNRNLKTFEVDINTSLFLANKIPSDKVKISESGIGNINTIHILKEAGYNGFLIGETFMKAENPGEAFKKFVDGLKLRLV